MLLGGIFILYQMIKKLGGHVLNLSAKNINANVDSTNGFYMTILNNEMFNKFDPIIDQSKDIKNAQNNFFIN